MGKAEPRSWSQRNLVPSPHRLDRAKSLSRTSFCKGESDAAINAIMFLHEIEIPKLLTFSEARQLIKKYTPHW